jgi:hypothetical protein
MNLRLGYFQSDNKQWKLHCWVDYVAHASSNNSKAGTAMMR